MSGSKLGRMANQIAGFFQSYPEAQAVAGVQDHIIAYWTPKMRATLAEQIALSGEGLHPLVISAFADKLSTAHDPLARATAGPAEAGELGASDAG